MNDSLESTRRSARRFGFASLFVWATSGFVLDLLHAFRASAYLDVPLRRELLTWAHAHGVGLSLVVLAYAAVGVQHETERARRYLISAAWLMPLGFLLGLVGHGEADPGLPIVLVPIGGLSLLWGLFITARHA